MANARLLSRFAYTSLYFVLCLILLGLLLITPGDIIERSISHSQTYNIWILIIVYVVVAFFVFLFYSVRLYINKTVLAGIPKQWVPVEIGDVNKTVHRMIASGLDRSAAIAYEARPRVDQTTGRHSMPATARDLGVSASLQSRLWDGIEHKGWASPTSPDFPNIQYATVVGELPNLIEAKALTMLAPHDQPPIQDPETVALLQRHAHISLRDYIDRLTSLGVLNAEQTTTDFVHEYEYARFSTRPISNAHFQRLMHLFSETLKLMQPFDPAMLDAETQPSESGYSSPRQGSPAIDGPGIWRSATVSTQNSVRRPVHPAWPSSYTSLNTAPESPLGRRVASYAASSSSGNSGNSFAQSRPPYPAGYASGSSSIRSDRPSAIIRLATPEDDEQLPYVLNLGVTMDRFDE